MSDRSGDLPSGAVPSDHLPSGRVVVLPGTDHIIWAEDVDVIAGHVESVLAEVRSRPVGNRGH